MLKSIRWTLQLWHAFILLAVLVGFGSTLYFRIRHSRFQTIDTELSAIAHFLAPELRPPESAASRPPQRPPPQGPPPVDRRIANDPRPGDPDYGPFDPERDRPLWPDGAPPPVRSSAGAQISETFRRRFGSEARIGTYYAVWRHDGVSLGTSPDAPAIPAPAPVTTPLAATLIRQRGLLREAIITGPALSQVLVGRSVEKEEIELRQLVFTLAATGTGLLALGLLGGWLLSNQVMQPIRRMAAIAQDISATNLSRRIDRVGTDREMGMLAGVLNDMFGRIETAFDQQVRFTADASHELRTPLSIIYSNTQLSLTRTRTVEEYQQTLAITLRAAKRMKLLVEGLLVLARADAGKLEIKPAPFDLSAAIDDCAELLRPLAQEREVRLEIDAPPVEIVGDALRLSQLITNLLTNAIVYNRAKGSVKLSMLVEKAQVRLDIADTGIGVSAEEQKHLFERFYRVDTSRSRESGGTGLGLAICQSIAEAHGGKIGFTSQTGIGTTFTVILPRAQFSNSGIS